MIVLGADTHKRSHTLAAVSEATGRVLVDRTLHATRRSFDELLVWARSVDRERHPAHAPGESPVPAPTA